MKFFLGGYFSDNNDFILEGSTVMLAKAEYAYMKPDILANKEMSSAESDDFLKALNEIGVLKWKRNYMNMHVLDGTQWELEISYNQGKKKKISGSNAYPGIEKDDMMYTEEFVSFLKAMDELLGVKYFVEEED